MHADTWLKDCDLVLPVRVCTYVCVYMDACTDLNNLKIQSHRDK